jgi:hypothetical protein
MGAIFLWIGGVLYLYILCRCEKFLELYMSVYVSSLRIPSSMDINDVATYTVSYIPCVRTPGGVPEYPYTRTTLSNHIFI